VYCTVCMAASLAVPGGVRSRRATRSRAGPRAVRARQEAARSVTIGGLTFHKTTLHP